MYIKLMEKLSLFTVEPIFGVNEENLKLRFVYLEFNYIHFNNVFELNSNG